MATTSRRKSKGKQKIPMAKIENESDRLVTFSKRRVGIFKSASELGILCGAEIALLAFSPAGRVHSFGNPSVDYVIDKYLDQDNGGVNVAPETNNQEDKISELSEELARCQEQLDAETRRGEMLRAFPKENRVEEMGLEQLEDLMKKMEGFKEYIENIQVHKEGVMMDEAGPSGHGGVSISPPVAHEIECPVNLDLNLGISGYGVHDKPEGSNARKFHHFL